MKTTYTTLLATMWLATMWLLLLAAMWFTALWLTPHPAAAQVQALHAWWIDTGETDSTALAPRLVPISDINGDGLDDFAIRTGTHELRVYLGNTLPDTIPDITIHKPDSRLGWFGYGLFTVGDVNGDGFSDIIAGADKTDLEPHWRFAFLYYGGAAFDTIADLSFISKYSWENHYARKGAGLGDVNGDGYNDFAILDESYIVSTNPLIQGAIYIYYGGPSLDSIPDVFIHADSTLNRIGSCIAPLGDVNDDGYDDFVMSDQ